MAKAARLKRAPRAKTWSRPWTRTAFAWAMDAAPMWRVPSWAWLVTASKTVTRTASPRAPPSCWETLTSPDAAPASSGATSASDAEVRLTNEIPMPPPIRTMDTTICAYDVEAWTRVASSSPTVTIEAPIIITIF